METLDFKKLLLLIMTLCFGVFLSSCLSDDSDEFDSEYLCKTWYTPDGSYIQFNSDGTGIYTGNALTYSSDVKRYSFTYEYNSATRNLDIFTDSKTFHFIVKELSDTVLCLTDESGNEISFTPSSGEDTIEIQKLLGKWGYGGFVLTEFTEDKMINYNIEFVKEEIISYRLTSDNFIEVLEDGKWWPMWKITRLDDDMLTLVLVDDPSIVYRQFRILDEKDTVGDISLIYDKDWVSFDDFGFVHMSFTSNGKVMYKDVDGSYTYHFSYNKDNNKLVMYDGEEKEEYIIKKLTNHVLLFTIYNSQGTLDDVIELRLISEDSSIPEPEPEPNPEPKPDPYENRRIKSICRLDDVTDNPDYDYSYADVCSRYEFEYDENGRVSKILFYSDKYFPDKGIEYNSIPCTVYTYDYNEKGKLLINESTNLLKVEKGTAIEELDMLKCVIEEVHDEESYSFELNEKGMVVRNEYSQYNYSGDGYLQTFVNLLDGNLTTHYTWVDGNLYRASSAIDKVYEYTSLLNNYSIDLNGYIEDDFLPNYVRMPWDFTGNRSKNILNVFENVYQDDNDRITGFYDNNVEGLESIKISISYY